MTEDENRSAHKARLPLSARVPEAFKLADRIAREAVEREEKRGLKVPCSKECAACWPWLVRLSISEALYTYEGVFESEKS
jgi:hypothetical protein